MKSTTQPDMFHKIQNKQKIARHSERKTKTKKRKELFKTF